MTSATKLRSRSSSVIVQLRASDRVDECPQHEGGRHTIDNEQRSHASSSSSGSGVSWSNVQSPPFSSRYTILPLRVAVIWSSQNTSVPCSSQHTSVPPENSGSPSSEMPLMRARPDKRSSVPTIGTPPGLRYLRVVMVYPAPYCAAASAI